MFFNEYLFFNENLGCLTNNEKILYIDPVGVLLFLIND